MLFLFRSEFDPRIEKSSRASATNMGIWECTLCGHCAENCPQSIPIPELILKLRENTVEMERELVPAPLRDIHERLLTQRNSFEEPHKEPIAWGEERNLTRSRHTPEAILYVIGRDPYSHPRAQAVVQAMIDVFEKSGVACTTLGVDEVSVGDPAAVTGNVGMFKSLATITIENFQKHGGLRIVTTSPHDYHLIKNGYPILGGAFPVEHYTRFLEELILSGSLKLRKSVKKTVAFHDPCYLGRYNNQYESPRNVLNAIPGLTLVEISPNRAQAECCGGGGNWMVFPAGERVSERRVKQALQTGADIIAVACPHCLSMLEDAIQALGCGGQVQARQVIELVHQVI
jgi:Fe-S oxidoreductase